MDRESLLVSLASIVPIEDVRRGLAYYFERATEQDRAAFGRFLSGDQLSTNGSAAHDDELPALPPNLAETWEAGLAAFLDPDPYLLRLRDLELGSQVDRLLGGGLSVGQTVAFGAAGAGVGKTAFLHQLADGVAAKSARDYITALERDVTPSVVPVLYVSEMAVRDLTIRSLARLAGIEGYVLRDPRGPTGCQPLHDGVTIGEDARLKAFAAAEAFEDAARFFLPLDRKTRVTISKLEDWVPRVRENFERQGAEVPAVLVVIDPLHRLIDPTRPEVEGLADSMLRLIDLAQRGPAIVVFTSDTNRETASRRGQAGSAQRGDELADLAEMAFRGNYQLLHLPDVALGLVTLRADDERLPAEDRERLEHQPNGTMYAEVVNAKSRWESRGLRAGYFLDPALFRFRPTEARDLPSDVPLEERIVRYVRTYPGCSESAVRKGVAGRDQSKREIIKNFIRSGRFVDEGTETTGRRLRIPGNTA